MAKKKEMANSTLRSWLTIAIIALAFFAMYKMSPNPETTSDITLLEFYKLAEQGKIVSPVVIAGLIAYSYCGLEWRAAAPYLAGALTVALQLWRRNPLLSILAGTAMYMALCRA